MKLLVTTWKKWFPIEIVSSKTKVGDVVVVKKQPYLITCVDKYRVYCVKYGFDAKERKKK